jgi:uncharacterized protein YdeI (YjbR/CyaY-like superfamily)
MRHDTYLVKPFKTPESFEKWLAANHEKADGLWLKIAKAGSGIRTITHNEALDIALCYGWIDGLRRGLDNEYFVQKFTPRRARSAWSVINRQKVAKLIRDGRMQPAGLNAINVAKKNGQWDRAYMSQRTIPIPGDFQKALDRNKTAKEFFAKLNSQNRYAILYRIHSVKKDETRKKKIEQYVSMLEQRKTIYPQD